MGSFLLAILIIQSEITSMFTKTLITSLLAAVSFSAAAADYYVVAPVKGKTYALSAVTVTLNEYSIPSGVAGVPYAGFDFKSVLQVVNDPAFSSSAATWALTAGALPSGLTLNPATGVLSGSPSSVGTYSFTLTATYKTKTGAHAYSVAVSDLVVSLGSATLPPATIGQAFSYDLGAKLSAPSDPAFSAASATWSVSPALPNGLTLNSAGVIAGVPGALSAAASYEVSAVYKTKTAKQTYSLGVQDQQAMAANYRLMLHIDGATNGSTATSSIVDSSPSPISVSAMGPTGVATVDNTSSVFGTGSLKLNNYWGGASWGAAYVTYPAQTSGDRRFAMGTGDFTVDSFVKSSGFGCYGASYFTAGDWDSTANVWTRSWSVEVNATGNLIFRVLNDNGTTAYVLTSSSGFTAATWAHIGVSRKAGTVRLFINGTQVGSGTYAGSTELTHFNSDVPFIIGKPSQNGNGCASGVHNFDEVRILKGYGATTLPVPTAPYVIPAN